MPTEDIPSVRRVLAEGWHFILPLGVIIGLLFAGYSPEFCAFWGTVSAAVLSWRHKATRMGPSAVLKGLVGGAQSNTSAGAANGPPGGSTGCGKSVVLGKRVDRRIDLGGTRLIQTRT